MLSYFGTDLNCPLCFNDVLEALSSTTGVDDVEGHSASSCISVQHRVEESSLQSIIATIGRTTEVADNAELVLGEAHADTRPVCGCGRSVPPTDNQDGAYDEQRRRPGRSRAHQPPPPKRERR